MYTALLAAALCAPVVELPALRQRPLLPRLRLPANIHWV
jgi:hypothetical protein